MLLSVTTRGDLVPHAFRLEVFQIQKCSVESNLFVRRVLSMPRALIKQPSIGRVQHCSAESLMSSSSDGLVDDYRSRITHKLMELDRRLAP